MQKDGMSSGNEKILKQKWTVGFRDRGNGHGDFAVITTKGDFVTGPCSHEVAGHIAKVHNDAREKSKTRRSHKT
jgi:hypothetical protein